MAIGLNDDDFHKLPAHVKEQIRRELGDSHDDLERDRQAIQDKHEREAAARQKAAQTSWEADWEAGLARPPIGAERPPQARARLPDRTPDTPGRAHHAAVAVVMVLLVMAVLIGLHAPAEIAALPVLAAIALVGIVVAVK